MAMKRGVISVGPLESSIVKRRDNLKVRARAAAGVVASLRAQIKELQQQRDFLVTWKADMFTGADAEGSLVDVELQGVDGDRVHAHKAILASKSIEFEAMFRADTDRKVVWNLEMPYVALKAFVTFFYTGRVSSSVLIEYLTTLLDAAHKYNVQFLEVVCEDSLVKNMTSDNVISIFDVAKKHCSSGCKEAVLKKARSLGELSSFTEYKFFTQSNPGLLLELYELLTDRSDQSPTKKMKLSRGNESEQANGDKAPLSDEDNMKSETDEDESVDDEEVKTATDSMPDRCRIPHAAQWYIPVWNTNLLAWNTDARSPIPSSWIRECMLSTSSRGFLRGALTHSPGQLEAPILEEVVAGKKKVSEGEDPKKPKVTPWQQKEKRCLLRGVKTTHNKNKKFIATITVKGQQIGLGKCCSEEEAGRLYDRAAFVIGRKTNNELPDDMKEELKGISWDDFIASLQEVTALEKIHHGKLDNGDSNEIDCD
ncbi:uncharacterized protein [Physcomitrium patens]|uniref:uncharacterized protein isoform X2 n=1 Tax=Physcomitrium patens TaxID=3218 RepID=UPI000D154567|nr:uncharacterized protein LOC112281025 isoform X3 [Physcomitrium patens]XP_024372919.1 uncharacterized protein LOC112281025 isoform X3 [Physcomitrium patens]|eukprot:XP_024372918.1 uncharacterized protein LOC112281025 isoform X3 [Physcomitrella patens]